MIFCDRRHAGTLLADRLQSYRDDPRALVLALPRGGVVVGYEVSRLLHLPLDVLIARKLGAPANPEYAIGAVSENGNLYVNPKAVEECGLSLEAVAQAAQAQRREITRRQQLYRGGRPMPTVADRTVILVDDGLATGATFVAAVEAIKRMRPRRLIGAVPVGPKETVELVRTRVDDLIVLEMPEPFGSVGNHYEDFEQVRGEGVGTLLESARRSRGRPAHLSETQSGGSTCR